ncbi:MAG: Rpp14/Pop5 family protein [Candidatus Micrarchaeia archaeon]
MVMKKTVRDRYRYIHFMYEGEHRSDLEKWLRAEVMAMVGLINMPYIKLVSYDQNTNTGIIKCSKEGFERLRSALIFMYGKNYRIKLISSSGTIKSLL